VSKDEVRLLSGGNIWVEEELWDDYPNRDNGINDEQLRGYVLASLKALW
jgi:hypothetical protein